MQTFRIFIILLFLPVLAFAQITADGTTSKQLPDQKFSSDEEIPDWAKEKPKAVPTLPATEEAFSPHQGGTALIVRTIGDAQKSIRVAAYTFTSHKIAEALADAHQRGVNVQVVLNKSQLTSRSSVAGWLADNGIPVRFNSH